jgi:hypothetical protein
MKYELIAWDKNTTLDTKHFILFPDKFYPFRSSFAVVHKKPVLQETLYGQGLVAVEYDKAYFCSGRLQ